jgi:replicative DNA helicase
VTTRQLCAVSRRDGTLRALLLRKADLILGEHRNGPTKMITVAEQLHLSWFANTAH